MKKNITVCICCWEVRNGDNHVLSLIEMAQIIAGTYTRKNCVCHECLRRYHPEFCERQLKKYNNSEP